MLEEVKMKVPWARPRSDFTLLFEALLMAMVKEMPVAAIASTFSARISFARAAVSYRSHKLRSARSHHAYGIGGVLLGAAAAVLLIAPTFRPAPRGTRRWY